MKKIFSRFVKQERGVVMMEYVVLGVFTVAVTVVAAMTLGIAYTGQLNTMSLATMGSTSSAVSYENTIKSLVIDDVKTAEQYLQSMDTQKDTGSVLTTTDPKLYQ